MKRCYKCGIEKSLDDFHKNKSKPDGRKRECKSCVKADQEAKRDHYTQYLRTYRESNRDRVNEAQRQARAETDDARGKKYRESNKEKVQNRSRVIDSETGEVNLRVVANNMLKNARYRAQKQGVPFEIDVEYVLSLLQNPVCFYFDIPLQPCSGKFDHACSPSLDRLVPEKGYVPGNLVLCSFKANSIKDKGSLQELKMIVSKLEQVFTESTADSTA